MKRKIMAIVLLILIFSNVVLAEGYRLPDPSYEFYIYDELGILDKDTKDYIIDINKKLYNEVGVQVVIAIIESFNQFDKQMYSTKLFEKWKVGSEGKDNGILVVISPKEGEMWIETGYGLEGAFPDSLQKRIIDNDFVPYFIEGDYNTGILSGFNRMIKIIEQEYNIDINGLKEVEEHNSNKSSPLLIIIIIILIFIDIKFFGGNFLALISRSLFVSTRYGSGPPSGGNRNSGSSGGGGRSGGGGAGGSW